MKKFSTILASLGLVLTALIGFSFFSAPAASAGESPNIQVCHATGSDTNPYTVNTISKTAVVKGTGHGGHADDIIPSFTYGETKDGPLKTYPGQNWTTDNQALYKNSCVKSLTVVAPVAPTYTPGTCINPNGVVTLADQPEGVTLNFGPKLEGNIWKVSYVPAQGYKFSTETSGIFAFTVISPNSSDPNWDAETGGCGLPQVGAGNIVTNLLPYAVGLGGAGILFFFLSRRRQSV